MDQFTEVSEQGLGGNLMDSIKGVVGGLLLFVISFPVLWWNEGRPDLSREAKKSVVVDASSVSGTGDGKLVSVTGPLKTTEKLGDPQFLQPGDYLTVSRQVEMFAWTEEVDSKTKKKLGGGKRTETTYTYEMEWTSSPQSGSKFKVPQGHENPPLPVESQTFKAQKGQVGAYTFQASEADLPSGEALTLTQDMLKGAAAPSAAPAEPTKVDEDAGDAPRPAVGAPAEDDEAPAKATKPVKKKRRHGRRHRLTPAPSVDHRPSPAARPAAAAAGASSAYGLVDGKYLFRGKGRLDNPKLGDVRIHYSVLRPGGQVTILGQKQGGQIQSYTDGDVHFYRVLRGDRDAAIQTLATEHKLITWGLRLLGFFLMWFGLQMFFGPINAVLDIIPFLGSAGRFVVGLATLPFALLMSTVVIILSIIAHSPILLVLTLAALGAGGYFLYQKRRKK